MSLEEVIKRFSHVWVISKNVYGVLPCVDDEDYMVVTSEDARAPFLCECAMDAWHSEYEGYWDATFEGMIDEFLQGLNYEVEWRRFGEDE